MTQAAGPELLEGVTRKHSLGCLPSPLVAELLFGAPRRVSKHPLVVDEPSEAGSF